MDEFNTSEPAGTIDLSAALAQAAADTVYRLLQDRVALRPCQASSEIPQWRVTVTVEPVETARLGHSLSECERDILAFVASQEGYTVGSTIHTGLYQAQQFHGESTINQALARLVREGLLGNHRTAPRGYFSTEKGKQALREVSQHV